MVTEWQGDNPFYLVISMPDQNVAIDLDQPGWVAENSKFFREPGMWFLVHKITNAQILGIIVRDGDQPYYTARHIGVMGSAGSNQVTAYGIGKKRPDGFVERLWLMPNGTVYSGDDVDDIGVRLVHLLGPK